MDQERISQLLSKLPASNLSFQVFAGDETTETRDVVPALVPSASTAKLLRAVRDVKTCHVSFISRCRDTCQSDRQHKAGRHLHVMRGSRIVRLVVRRAALVNHAVWWLMS